MPPVDFTSNGKSKYCENLDSKNFNLALNLDNDQLDAGVF